LTAKVCTSIHQIADGFQNREVLSKIVKFRAAENLKNARIKSGKRSQGITDRALQGDKHAHHRALFARN
jgi:hypothetical protein